MNDDRLLAGARTVHVRMTLAPEDNASMNTSLPPVLVNAPFYSTTDMLAETSYKYFKSYLPPLMGRAAKDVDDWAAAWFTLKGVVVSGRQIPVGVLSTYMYPAGQAPLELVVHFSKAYPPEVCPFRAVSRSQQHLIFNPRHMYFNSFKEALSILTGKGQQVPFMMPDAWKAVWAAARDGNLKQHHDNVHNCKSPIETKPCKRSGQVDMQIPLRILVCRTPQAGQALCKERFYSRPAAVERFDGSRPTLMDTLYSICPAVFGPAVACQLSVEGVEPEEHVTLQCNCQLEVQSAAESPDIPDLLASRQNNAEVGGDSSCVAVTVQHEPQSITGTLQEAESPEPLDSKVRSAVDSENDPLGDTHRAEEAQAQTRDNSESSRVSNFGVMKESSLPGAVCESNATGEAEEAATGPQELGGPASADGPGSIPEQVTGSDSAGTVAASSIPPDSPAVQSEKGRGVSTPDSVRHEHYGGRESAQIGLCPAKVVSGCLHKGVQVQVAGVRVQAPGGSGELLQASLLALHELLHAPDMFLYIVVHMPPELCSQ